MHDHFRVNQEGSGFWAQCVELVGCITQAESYDELMANMREALCLYLDEPDDSEDVIPPPNPNIRPANAIVEVSVEPRKRGTR